MLLPLRTAPADARNAPPSFAAGRSIALAALCFILFSFVPPGIAPSVGFAEAGAVSPDAGENPHGRTDPSSGRLSPEAEYVYYCLLLAQSMSDNALPTILMAVDALLTLDPSLSAFQESAGLLLYREKSAEAETIALRGLERFPDDSLLTLLLAGAYGERGETARAIGLLEDYLGRHPEEHTVIEELVRLYLRQGQKEKAADMLAALPADASPPEAALFRAKALTLLDRPAEALDVLRRLLSREADAYEGWIAAGHLYLQEKNLAGAAAAFTQAAALSDSPDLWFRAAMLHLERKVPREAVRALDNIRSAPDIFIQAALRFSEGGYFPQAESMLDRAAAGGANPDEISLLLSMIRQESAKDPLAGLEALEKISPNSEFYPRALYQKARIHLQAKQYAKSYAIAANASKRFPDLKELWGIEAYALVKLKQSDKAEKVLKKALERHAGDEDLLFTLGTVQDDANKKNEAMKTMEAILSSNPKNHQALNYVGYSLAEKNTNLTYALELITAALEQNPDADYIVDSLAWVHYRLGNLEEAWKNINRCISLGGDDPTMWEHYGDIANALNRREEAIKGYTESIARKPANIADVRKKLAELQKK
jgi:predicted Zn-dependent protease